MAKNRWVKTANYICRQGDSSHRLSEVIIAVKFFELDINVVLSRNVSVMLTPEVKVGDYVLLHTGYAINIIDQDEASETLRLLKEIAKQAE